MFGTDLINLKKKGELFCEIIMTDDNPFEGKLWIKSLKDGSVYIIDWWETTGDGIQIDGKFFIHNERE